MLRFWFIKWLILWSWKPFFSVQILNLKLAIYWNVSNIGLEVEVTFTLVQTLYPNIIFYSIRSPSNVKTLSLWVILKGSELCQLLVWDWSWTRCLVVEWKYLLAGWVLWMRHLKMTLDPNLSWARNFPTSFLFFFKFFLPSS